MLATPISVAPYNSGTRSTSVSSEPFIHTRNYSHNAGNDILETI